MRISPAIKQRVLRGLARAGNLGYELASASQRKKMRTLMAIHPDSFVPSPEVIEAHACRRIPYALQRIIEHLTGITVPTEKLERLINQGLAKGTCVNYGVIVYINRRRIQRFIADLLEIEELQGTTLNVEGFVREATERALLRQHVFTNQITLGLQADYRRVGNEFYRIRGYDVPIRDGKIIRITCTNLHKGVSANDDNPSVLLLNGIACTKETFDLSDDASFLLEQAKRKRWVYQFDYRGQGENVGKPGEFEKCFVDTYVSNDLPAILEFIYNRPSAKKKPVILVAHSMGGMIAEFTVVRQAHKLNELIEKIAHKTGTAAVNTRGHSRREVETYLAQEVIVRAAESNEELADLVAAAHDHLEVLNSIKAVITLGAPKIFDKNSHPLYPALLMLLIILPLLRRKKVPAGWMKWLTNHFPKAANIARLLINSENFSDPEAFLARFIGKGVDDFQLGVGLQFEKDIYSGKGLRRMGKSKFNYSAHLDEIPVDLPLFHLVGSHDILCPPFNLAFIDHGYYQENVLSFDRFPNYGHQHKKVIYLPGGADSDSVPLSASAGQVQGILIEGVGHLDYLYGKTAERVVQPLVNRIIETIWQV